MRRTAPILWMGLVWLGGCAKAPSSYVPPAVVERPAPPTGGFLFVPKLTWEDGKRSMRGTGFLVRDDQGRVLAMGNGSTILQDRLPTEALFISLESGGPMYRSGTSWGPVGDGDPSTPAPGEPGLGEDFYALVIEDEVEGATVLELDDRLPVGEERVWFPSARQVHSRESYEVLAGTVYLEDGAMVLVLDQPLTRGFQIGTPVISQRTGNVLGALARAFEGEDGSQSFHLAPATDIATHLRSERGPMPLLEACRAERGADPGPDRELLTRTGSPVRTTADPELAGYVQQLRGLFMGGFHPPSAIIEDDPEIHCIVGVQYDLDTGAVTGTSMRESSGHPGYDAAAMEAAAAVASLPLPPDRFHSHFADGFALRFELPASDVGVQGHLTKEAVSRVVNDNVHEVQGCYERQLLKQQGLAGRLVFEWTVTLDGSVRDVQVASSTLPGPEVGACIVESIRGWRFPPPEGGEVVISYPFLFRSVGG